MSSSYFTFINLKKNIRFNIFITIQHLKHFYLVPLNLRISSVVSPHSFDCSSYLRSISPGMGLVALLCIFSSISYVFPGIWTPCLYTIFQVRSNYCFIQRYNQTFVLICNISANHSQNLVTLRRCNSALF